MTYGWIEERTLINFPVNNSLKGTLFIESIDALSSYVNSRENKFQSFCKLGECIGK